MMIARRKIRATRAMWKISNSRMTFRYFLKIFGWRVLNLKAEVPLPARRALEGVLLWLGKLAWEGLSEGRKVVKEAKVQEVGE